MKRRTFLKSTVLTFAAGGHFPEKKTLQKIFLEKKAKPYVGVFIALFDGDKQVSKFQPIAFHNAIDERAFNSTTVTFTDFEKPVRVTRIAIGDGENIFFETDLIKSRWIYPGDTAQFEEGSVCVSL